MEESYNIFSAGDIKVEEGKIEVVVVEETEEGVEDFDFAQLPARDDDEEALVLRETDINDDVDPLGDSSIGSPSYFQDRKQPQGSYIHPFDLKVARLSASPSTHFGRQMTSYPEEEAVPLQQLPDATSPLSKLESIVRTFINNTLSSRKDPRCRHLFYLTIHKVLNEALSLHLLFPEDVDSYWKKYDDWAASSTSYRLGDHYMLQYRHRANDPGEAPPKPEKVGRSRSSKFGGSSSARIYRTMLKNLEATVKEYVTHSKCLPIRDDLFSRVQVYQHWQKYYNPGNEIVLDFFWNALVNRTPAYYCGAGLAQLVVPEPEAVEKVLATPTRVPAQFQKVAPEPPPKKRRPEPPPLPSLSSSPPKRSLPSPRLPPTPPKEPAIPPSSKNLDMDRLVKLTINSCLASGQDPKSSHKFYWTIHRSLETVQSLNLPPSEVDALWTKYDRWAELSVPFQVVKVESLYSDVTELPPPVQKVSPKRPLELEVPYPAGLCNFLEKTVRRFIVMENITENHFRDNLKRRRYFLESYVQFVEPFWEDTVIDQYWRRLLRDTVKDYKDWKPVPPPPPPVPVPMPNPGIPKKLDMDRLIQIYINSCLASGQDPRTSHKFYWTVHRALETVSSLNLPQVDVDLLWKKYDDWASRKKLFVLRPRVSSEFYEDVRELPVPPGPPSPLPSQLGEVLRRGLKRFRGEEGIPGGLEGRRRFFESYKNFVPVDCQMDGVIDRCWRRLLGKKRAPVEKKKEGEGIPTLVPLGSDDKQFNMDFLVKKVISSCVHSGVDPRSTHRFYWTVHRCLQECRRRNPRNRVTNYFVDSLWSQYDAMAGQAFTGNAACFLDEAVKSLGDTGRYYSDVGQLPPLPEPEVPAPPITQLYPNCPKSTVLGRFLEARVRRILSRSTLVGVDFNGIREDLKTRRGFWEEYLPYVEEITSASVESKVDSFWRRLLTEKKEPGRDKGAEKLKGPPQMYTVTSSSFKFVGSPQLSSSTSSAGVGGKPEKKVELEVLCIELD